MTSLLARVRPMRIIGVDVVDAALRAFRVLWPHEPRPSMMEGLIRFLDATDDRLQEWRESSARAGADEALKVVLSWYEGIKLEVLRGIRTNGKYVTDPELIKKRQEIAYSSWTTLTSPSLWRIQPTPRRKKVRMPATKKEIGRAHV